MMELDEARALLGQMIRNAQALAAVLAEVDFTVPERETQALADQLQTIAQVTMQHTATLQAWTLEAAIDRRTAERRPRQDRPPS